MGIKLKTGDVKRRYGVEANLTIYRWLSDPELNFPKPVVVRRTKIWDSDQLDAFDAENAKRRQQAQEQKTRVRRTRRAA
jgi:hypothetical protein